MENNEFVAYGLVISFPDQSESFVHGFEAGEIYKELELGVTSVKPPVPIHTANKEIICRMCDVHGYDVEFTDSDYEEWTYISITKRPEHRHKLRVIK